MNQKIKIGLTATIIFGLMVSFASSVSAEDPSYEDIEIDPEEPTRLSDVTFTVELTGDNITEVRIRVEECTDSFCYQDIQNESMSNNEGDTWEATVTLIHDDTVYGTVWLEVLTDEKWYNFQESRIEFDVAEAENGENGENGDNGNGENGENGDNGTPGFEFAILIISLIIGILVYNKKRIR